MKYPKIPNWNELSHEEKTELASHELVITEKIDGVNVAIHDGTVYSRSRPGPWLDMVRKHHAFKTQDFVELIFYGEDIFGVHSIEYKPVEEKNTFFLFAVYGIQSKAFANWAFVESASKDFGLEFTKKDDLRYNIRGFQTVPMLHRDARFDSPVELERYVKRLMSTGSRVGYEMEGVIVRNWSGFYPDEMRTNIVKFVRPGHVQPDPDHWMKNWKKCKIEKEKNNHE